MLVLNRKLGEQIRIGESILLTVLRINADGSVKLGFDAPAGIEIDRLEVRLQKELRKKRGEKEQ